MKKTIKAQIFSGYQALILIIIVMSLIAVGGLLAIDNNYKQLAQNRFHQNQTKQAVIAHYSWLNQLSDSISSQVKFEGALDPTACSLGKWLAEYAEAAKEDPQIQSAITALNEPHRLIHSKASELIELSKTDHDAAYAQYMAEIKPNVAIVIENINAISKVYENTAQKLSETVGAYITILILALVVLTVAAVLLALRIAQRTSSSISLPIRKVAGWSEELARGCDHIELTGLDFSKMHPDNEVAVMIRAFVKMAEGIHENAAIIKRVSDGDLTSYVNVRSEEDMLGRHLYRLVQSNDILFAEIIKVANHVASSASEISSASKHLADSTTEQASSMEELTATIAQINELSGENASKANEINEVFEGIRTDIDASTDKMSELMRAVEDIVNSSDRISSVIHTIDNISFQTNILALNASIEAARAGAAGKGFAVVADEVRDLAHKSALAAKETKELIEASIAKAHYGTDVARETNQKFLDITGSVHNAAQSVQDIKVASSRQKSAIEDINSSIQTISNAAEGNAASCEEASCASDEMSRSARVLQRHMSRFKLRKREPGKPYIPEEKKNDSEFVKIATQNYLDAIRRGDIVEGLDENDF